MLKYSYLFLSLPMESLLVSNYFQSYVLACFMIVAFEHLTEASFA